MSSFLPSIDAPLSELEKFSDVSAIITDLDGTFVKQDGDILGQLVKIQQKLSRCAITVSIATGRTYAGAREIAQQMKIKRGTPLALYNGAIILAFQSDVVLYRKTIPDLVIQDLCSLIDMENQYLLAYYCLPKADHGVEEIVLGFGNRAPQVDVNGMRVLQCSREQVEIFFDNGKASMFNEVSENSFFSKVLEPCSILLDSHLLGKRESVVSEYLNKCTLISSTRSGGSFWEIKASGVHKGTIFDFMSCNGKRVAIGDNDNDVELLKEADIGVVVANGSKAAKDAAQYQCRKDGTLGVLEVVEIIKAAKRYC